MAVRDNKKPARWRAEIVLSLLIMTWICGNATDLCCLFFGITGKSVSRPFLASGSYPHPKGSRLDTRTPFPGLSK